MFELRTIENNEHPELFETADAAHAALRAFAERRGLAVHIHPGNWEGRAISTAYRANGDMLLNAVAMVTRTDTARNPMASALQVLVLTPHIREYLTAHDPKALAQATRALQAAGLQHEIEPPLYTGRSTKRND